MENKLNNNIKIKYLLENSSFNDSLNSKKTYDIGCNSKRCSGSIVQPTNYSKEKSTEDIKSEATDFINQYYENLNQRNTEYHKNRISEILQLIDSQKTYELTEDELLYGAKTAWRNASRCIGRIHWSNLKLFDARNVKTAKQMFVCICQQIEYSFNNGNIRPALTLFKQSLNDANDFRIWNYQFFTYAGYQIDENKFIGDKNKIEFTNVCIKLGWKPKYTDYDILPLILQANGEKPELFEYPKELIDKIEIRITHPEYRNFEELNLRWYGLPSISSMLLNIGGINFTGTCFTVWYMNTEIARDIADIDRYDKLELIAEKLQLNTKTNNSLWKDKALVELNIAILNSYQKANVTIVDHHSASESFLTHFNNELKVRGGCPADWVWIVPPMSSHVCPVFHLEMLNYKLIPSFEYQILPWKTYKFDEPKFKIKLKNLSKAVLFVTFLVKKVLTKRPKCTILYATETGKSKSFALRLNKLFNNSFFSKCICMKDYNFQSMRDEKLLLFVSSTFNVGDSPQNGKDFKLSLMNLIKQKEAGLSSEIKTLNEMKNVNFSVFGLGNSSYVTFCAFSKFIDTTMFNLGANRISNIDFADELKDENEPFKQWSLNVYQKASKIYCSLTGVISKLSLINNLDNERIKLFNNLRKKQTENLKLIHNNNKIIELKLKQRTYLTNSVFNLEFDLENLNTEIKFKPGDHILIYPSNNELLVNKILKRFFANEDEISKGSELFSCHNLKRILMNYLDIITPLSMNLIKLLLEKSTSENEDKSKLIILANDQNAYEEWKKENLNLIEFLDEFKSLTFNPILLLQHLPLLRPRYYSISSSLNHIENSVHLTVGLVTYKSLKEKFNYGLCSKYLSNLNIGESISAFFKSSAFFNLPTYLSKVPIILIGAGTGISPFRGFWQHINAEKLKFSKNKFSCKNEKITNELVLFYGCRDESNQLYKNEIEEMMKYNVITSYFVAYSRDVRSKKQYVQELIYEKFENILELIMNKKAEIFICGKVNMANSVKLAIKDGLKLHGNLTDFEADSYLNEMIANQRVHEDIFN